jgi:hypothetical protein
MNTNLTSSAGLWWTSTWRVLLLAAALVLNGLPTRAATVAYWRFEEGPAEAQVSHGGQGAGVFYPGTADSSGNGNALSVWAEGEAGYAYRTDVPLGVVPGTGAANSFSVQNSGAYPGLFTASDSMRTMTPSQFTIEASFKPEVGWWRTIVGRDSRGATALDTNAAALYLQITPTDAVAIKFCDVSGYWHEAISFNGIISGFPAGNPDAGHWYHMAAVSDGTNLCLYLDPGTGFTLVGRTNMTLSGSPNTALTAGLGSGSNWVAGTWTVGRGLYAGAHANWAYGFIDEVRISDTALAPEQFLFWHPPVQATRWGNALDFDGVDEHVVLPGGFWFTNQFTIEAWVYERSYGKYVRIVDVGNPLNANSVVLYLDSTTGRPAFQIIGKGSVVAPQPIPTNLWVHLAASFQSGVGGILYVNGFAVQTNASMSAPNLVMRTNAFIGRSNHPDDPYADAMFDDVRIWGVARSATEIRDGLCHGLSGNEPNLEAYYRFDEGAGNVASDSSPHSRHGILVNGPAWRNSTIPGFINVTATVAPGLPGVGASSVAWGDYDNDGRLDFLLTGWTGSDAIAQVWRNTGSGFSNVTATVAPGLPGAGGGSVAWGGYDNDGRLDFLLTDWTRSGGTPQVWRNTGSGFTNVTATVAPGLPGVRGSSVAWGDYDNDGRLDFLLTGWTRSDAIAQVWRNTGSGLTNVTATVAPGLPGVECSSVAWGDYDTDGRLDFLLTGDPGSGRISQVWWNTGSGFTNVTATVAPGLPGVECMSVAWGDYDNDGRLDFLLTGDTGSSHIPQVWRNINWTSNTVPAAPTGLAATQTGSAVTLSWNPGSDIETPASGLTYNLCVGTTPGGSDIVSPNAGAAGARRLVGMGNVQQGLSVPLVSLPNGRFYWSVQAVDGAFAGGPFAPEQSFTVRPFLVCTRQGNYIRISWHGNGSLEESPSIRGPWVAVPGATSPYLSPPSAVQEFFRLRD